MGSAPITTYIPAGDEPMDDYSYHAGPDMKSRLFTGSNEFDMNGLGGLGLDFGLNSTSTDGGIIHTGTRYAHTQRTHTVRQAATRRPPIAMKRTKKTTT